MTSIKEQKVGSFLYACHIIHLIVRALLFSCPFHHVLDRFLFESNNP